MRRSGVRRRRRGACAGGPLCVRGASHRTELARGLVAERGLDRPRVLDVALELRGGVVGAHHRRLRLLLVAVDGEDVLRDRVVEAVVL